MSSLVQPCLRFWIKIYMVSINLSRVTYFLRSLKTGSTTRGLAVSFPEAWLQCLWRQMSSNRWSSFWKRRSCSSPLAELYTWPRDPRPSCRLLVCLSGDTGRWRRGTEKVRLPPPLQERLILVREQCSCPFSGIRDSKWSFFCAVANFVSLEIRELPVAVVLRCQGMSDGPQG